MKRLRVQRLLRTHLQTTRKAFTLLETVIGLGIFCFLTTISLYNLKDYQAKLEEKQSLEWFKDTFKGVFNHAYLTHRSSKFMIDNGNTIIFDISAENKETKEIKRKLPSTLKFNENSRKEYTISSSGQASPVTIIIKSTLTNRTYKYTVQLGWGEIIEEKT